MPNLRERIQRRTSQIKQEKEIDFDKRQLEEQNRNQKFLADTDSWQVKEAALLIEARSAFNNKCLPILREVSGILGIPMRSVVKGFIFKEQVSDFYITETATEITAGLTWDYHKESRAMNSGRVVSYDAWKAFGLGVDGMRRIQYRGQWYEVSRYDELDEKIVEDVARGDFLSGDNGPEDILSEAP